MFRVWYWRGLRVWFAVRSEVHLGCVATRERKRVLAVGLWASSIFVWSQKQGSQCEYYNCATDYKGLLTRFVSHTNSSRLLGCLLVATYKKWFVLSNRALFLHNGFVTSFGEPRLKFHCRKLGASLSKRSMWNWRVFTGWTQAHTIYIIDQNYSTATLLLSGQFLGKLKIRLKYFPWLPKSSDFSLYSSLIDAAKEFQTIKVRDYVGLLYQNFRTNIRTDTQVFHWR